jgi:hypothetical protein
MQQRDLIKDEIERLGKVLARVLADFIGKKSNGNVNEGFSNANLRLKNELNIDVEDLLSFSKKELKGYFESQKLIQDHLEILAELFKEIGLTKNDDDTVAQQFIIKAIEILDVAEELSKSVSFNRDKKRNELMDLLK